MPFLVVAFMCLASAQEDVIKNALSANGISSPSVSIAGSEVTIAYNQSISAFGTFDAELAKVAGILKAVSDNMPSATSVIIEQHFDDGQIMVIVGKPADGVAFLSGQINAEAFLAKLDFKPLTRGPPIMEGICEPSKGDTCQIAPECMCYPNEACQPGDQGANLKGCVAQQVPANAHLVGTEYVCNDGYEWNSKLTGCVPAAAPQGGVSSGSAGDTATGGSQTPGTPNVPGSTTATSISQEGVMNILTILGMVVVPLVILLILILVVKRLTRKG